MVMILANKKTLSLATPVEAARNSLSAWIAEAESCFPERSKIIAGMVVCAIAKTNLIMYGPPGTAKSMLARAFSDALEGNIFDVLMSKYTVPNELFGPVDVQALKQGHMKRVVRGFLPEAHVAFLDEGFKANSACLNSLLTAVNEHEYHDDGARLPIPLRLAVLASNEFPEDNDNLQAFDDRFPMRFDVKPMKREENFRAVINDELDMPTAKFTVQDLEEIANEAKSVVLGSDVLDALWVLRAELGKQQIYVSDRKMKICGRLLKAYGALHGMKVVTTAHVGILEDVLWLRPDQKSKVQEMVRQNMATWLRDIRTAVDVVQGAERQLEKAIKKNGNSSELVGSLGKITQKLKDLNADKLQPLQHVPEAKTDVASLQARINKVLKNCKEALASTMGL
jgi:MoxR-like ATPase